MIGVRYAAVAFGGAMAGIGGAYFPLVLTPLWAEGLTGGRGWIAIALVVFAGWRPVWLLGGAYFFGLLGTLELYAKASGASWTIVLPSEAWAALPYLATVVVLAAISVSKSGRRQRAGLPRQAVHSVDANDYETRSTGETTCHQSQSTPLHRRCRRRRHAAATGQKRLGGRCPLKVGFIYVGPINDGGWNTAHEAGRQAMLKALGDKVTSVYVENVAGRPGQRARAARPRQPGLQADLRHLVSATWTSRSRSRKAFPDIKVEMCTGCKPGAEPQPTTTSASTRPARSSAPWRPC